MYRFQGFFGALEHCRPAWVTLSLYEKLTTPCTTLTWTVWFISSLPLEQTLALCSPDVF